ncbi:hypothetical protein [Leifsonia sp. Leaf264]|uniref:hypothetical protein n=1 Tax=Leifsonia sp. Leaf264 TaxID=1736314 RepID=UPI0009EA65AC|nr:hypothetical protein [Leifsonia sp. Leaf264]
MTCLICGATLPPGAMFCGECGSSTTATPLSRTRTDPRPGDTTIIEPLRPGGLQADPAPGSESAPATAATADAAAPGAHTAAPVAVEASTFILSFSTGEQWAVSGTGLIGRRPLQQPTEYHDELIAVADRGLSVSKTHLEFGQHGGELWVCDRFSGNGTIIRRPHEPAMRCDPGRRYLVPRGSRVDIGEQHFTVS